RLSPAVVFMIDWRHWHNEPILIGGLVLLGWLYAILTGPLRRYLAPAEPYPVRKACWFYAALLSFYIAVGSPLDQIGERFLLSAHMVQHHIMTYGSALMILLGIPAWAVDPLLNKRGFRTIFRVLLSPMICAFVFALVMSVWHAPKLYDWALQDKNIHVIEHVMFFAVSLMWWWPVASPSKVRPKLSYGYQIVYLLVGTVLMIPVFAFIAFSDNVLYPTYEYAPRLIDGFMPMDDQLLGAVVMKMGGMSVTSVAIIVAFYRWYRESEGRRSTSPKSLKAHPASQ
ncbi:MAG TPA: cytochrome c oxidase assembly protein, partial [Opitutaceae bacterium]